MAAIQNLVLTFCPKMHGIPQRKLKLLMPVTDLMISRGSGGILELLLLSNSCHVFFRLILMQFSSAHLV